MRDNLLVRSGIEMVCRTYDSDCAASKEILSLFLTQEHLTKLGYQGLTRLGSRNEEPGLMLLQEFVRDIYVAAFGFEETTMIKTAHGVTDRILPLTSNKRQDYDHALWQLGETFSTFLAASAELAMEALTTAVEASLGHPNLHA